MDVARLIIATLLPWIVGAALVDVLVRRDGAELSGRVPWLAGAGWYVGTLLSTLMLRAASALGVGFSFAWSASAFALIAAALLVLRRPAISVQPQRLLSTARWMTGYPMGGKTRALWLVLVAWLVLRFALLATEVGTRPLYPWDAWTAWATKARVFQGLGHLVRFADTANWLAAQGAAWFDARPSALLTLPLVQTWSALAIGRWDDVLVNWSWWLAGLALALAVFGGLRMIGIDRIAALVAVWLVASLPLLNVHVALAGYPDLFVAALHTLAALSLLSWTRLRTVRSAVHALLFIGAALYVKPVSWVWLVGLAAGAALAAWPARAPRWLGLGIATLMLAAALLSRTDASLTNPQWQLLYRPTADKTFESWFLLGNWHLLWYGVAAMALIARKEILVPALAPVTAIVGVGLLYIGALTAFPSAQLWLGDVTTLSEATLQLAPVAVLWLVLTFRTWAAEFGAGQAKMPAFAPADSVDA